ncbi:MAG TPA: 50S ribosomal protein L33 [Candidatus Cloacimonas sp.]|nr:50S ribosomal protein L33 [Candidatus Cloacimonas sp.]
MREIIVLACEECKSRNYTTTKNRRTHPKRVAYKKFCPKCKKHTNHKQTR